MLRLLIIAQNNNALGDLHVGLTKNGFNCSIISRDKAIIEQLLHQPPDLILVEINGHFPASQNLDVINKIKKESHLPIIAMINKGVLDSIDGNLDVDDFLTNPYDAKELSLRIKRLLNKTRTNDNDEIIRCNSLVIDTAKCEVTVEGQIIELTFKEYELLKFLASNKGRVYTREALLNQIWGYDYYGGDRTVDVHIRRLRSKIENSNHCYIETVRNIGYRFKKDIKPHSVCNINLTYPKYSGNNRRLD